MISCFSAYGTGAALAMSVIIDDRSARGERVVGQAETMRFSWVGAEKVLVTRCSFTRSIQRRRVELAQHDDRRAQGVRQRRERERTGVVQRPGREVHRVLVQHVELAEQGEHDLAVGAGAERALRLPGGARRVDHRRAGLTPLLDLGLGARLAFEDVVPTRRSPRARDRRRRSRSAPWGSARALRRPGALHRRRRPPSWRRSCRSRRPSPRR